MGENLPLPVPMQIWSAGIAGGSFAPRKYTTVGSPHSVVHKQSQAIP